MSTTEFDIMIDMMVPQAFELLENDQESLTEEEFRKKLEEDMDVNDHIAGTLVSAWFIKTGKREPYQNIKQNKIGKTI